MTRAPLSPARTAALFHRDPAQVMQLARLGLAHPTRLSFLRILLRRMQRENWRFDQPVFDIDANGVGRAVYRAIGPERTYSLVAFAHDLPADMRSDRVIATAWDATFALYDGTPDAADLDRLAANVPLQEAGRVTQKELTLSRANQSERLFEHVIQCLSEGRQPDADDLAATGYLMRTTAVYGSGKFGAATHHSLSDRPETAAPFQAEMLTVWMVRTFTVDLVNHLARMRDATAAVPLDRNLRRNLGVGNSTGLGMAPFLVRHPILLHNWMMAREKALARVRAQQTAAPDKIKRFIQALKAAQENATVWTSAHPLQQERLAALRAGLDRIAAYVGVGWDQRADYPWDTLWHWGQAHLDTEAQEALLSLMLEPHGGLIDELEAHLSADETTAFAIDGSQQIAALKALLAKNYDWALEVDYDGRKAAGRFWYVSEDKLEPRLGERFEEPGSDRELPLDIARQAAALFETLKGFPDTAPVARLLLAHPQHRSMVRRVQLTATRPFAEIRDNLIDADMLPIDMLRCKLACFGASRFDPRSDRWVRISLFQNAPYPTDLHTEPDL
jgi:hypothetical protein